MKWWVAWAGALIGLVVLTFLLARNQPPPVARAARIDAPGFEALGSCTDTVSVEGNKKLSLSEDGRAAVSGSDEAETIKGNWRFSGAAYNVTFPGISATYKLVTVENVMCMLVKGEMGNANLHESWVASLAPTYDNDAAE